MKHLTCKDVEPLLPASAAGALDGEDEQVITAHLATCPPCVQHLRDFQATVEQLAYAVPQVDPPSTLRIRVLQAIVITPPPATPPLPRNGSSAIFPDSSPPFLARVFGIYRRLAPAALAVCLVLLAGAGLWITTMAAGMARTEAMYNLLADPDARVTAFWKDGAATSGQMIMSPNQHRLGIMLAHMPPAPAGRSYKIWLLCRDRLTPIPSTVIAVDGDGRAMAVVDLPTDQGQVAGMRVTDEPQADSPAPTGSAVIEGWYACP